MSCEVINPTAALPELGEVSACTHTTAFVTRIQLAFATINSPTDKVVAAGSATSTPERHAHLSSGDSHMKETCVSKRRAVSVYMLRMRICRLARDLAQCHARVITNRRPVSPCFYSNGRTTRAPPVPVVGLLAW